MSSSYLNPSDFAPTVRRVIALNDTAGAVTKTVLPEESGSIFTLTLGNAASTITLPAPDNGLNYDFVLAAKQANVGASSTIATNGAANILRGFKVDANAAPAGVIASKNTISIVKNTALAGDRISLVCDGTSWCIVANSQVDGGFTFN